MDQRAIGHHLVVQVVARGAAGGTDVANHVAALDLIAFLDVKVEQVTVASPDAKAVVERDEVAVIALRADCTTSPSAVA